MSPGVFEVIAYLSGCGDYFFFAISTIRVAKATRNKEHKKLKKLAICNHCTIPFPKIGGVRSCPLSEKGTTADRMTVLSCLFYHIYQRIEIWISVKSTGYGTFACEYRSKCDGVDFFAALGYNIGERAIGDGCPHWYYRSNRQL